MKSLGLALGGGGLKGLAHIGVLQVLEENQVAISAISGSSAGSIVAALYASGLSPWRMQELAMQLKVKDYIDYNYLAFIKFFAAILLPGVKASLDGLIKGDKLEKLLYEWTRGKTLAESRVPLSIIACDINSGREIIFTNQNIEAMGLRLIIREALLSEAVRASTSIPAAFVPLQFRGMQMVDGGVKEMVPVEIQKIMGADVIVSVNLGRESYTEKVTGIVEIVSRSLNILAYETSATAEALFADLLIHPQVKDVHLDDIEQAEKIIRAGRRAAKARIEEIKRRLQD
ncbi:MAG: patatin-like phospholipase family protein [Syntrophomonas sp.]|uniref:patatin-like phospholipase family protein n=1 Tax=Syntrophomonas sp. TaxID=2053627 RepID=UPI0026078C8D|nr:patatin-like phospholipase family protein [Syntrophomonas sp.]MDD3879902.1 patatin-like phospholipase family protein [Syntrophomonas sp.]MDD4626349.1 patatin-like phospholipase family protein [Syntrophomonas sp.]